MTVDAAIKEQIRIYLERWLGVASIVLQDIGVRSTWICFKAKRPDGSHMFVKVAIRSYCERTLRFCLQNGDCALIPRSLVNEAPTVDFDLFDEPASVSCLEWKTGEWVDPSDMTKAQTESLLSGYVDLSKRMAKAEGVRPLLPEDDPDSQYRVCEGYARKHPWVSKALKPLLDVSPSERSYSGYALVPIHGDFRAANYAFKGERLSVVFDWDALTVGLPCEDLTYAFARQLRIMRFPSRRRRALLENFRRTVAASPWPVSEWLIGVNHVRLRIAQRRLSKHNESARIGFDVWWRDRAILPLLNVLNGLR